MCKPLLVTENLNLKKDQEWFEDFKYYNPNKPYYVSEH